MEPDSGSMEPEKYRVSGRVRAEPTRNFSGNPTQRPFYFKTLLLRFKASWSVI